MMKAQDLYFFVKENLKILNESADVSFIETDYSATFAFYGRHLRGEIVKNKESGRFACIVVYGNERSDSITADRFFRQFVGYAFKNSITSSELQEVAEYKGWKFEDRRTEDGGSVGVSMTQCIYTWFDIYGTAFNDESKLWLAPNHQYSQRTGKTSRNSNLLYRQSNKIHCEFIKMRYNLS